jgi:anti-sigma B factor antagonist
VFEDPAVHLAKHCSMRSARHLATTIVRLAGEFDLTCTGPFEQALDHVLDRDTLIFILDLRGLEFIDSTGLATLIRLDERARRYGLDFTILCAEGLVRQALRETGLEGLLPVVDPVGGLVPQSDSPV